MRFTLFVFIFLCNFGIEIDDASAATLPVDAPHSLSCPLSR